MSESGMSMERRRYLIIIEQANDGGFGAYAPDVPGCIGLGASIHEAMRSFSESLELWIEETVREGGTVPRSVSHPAFVEVEVPSGEATPHARILAHTGLASLAGVEPETLSADELRRLRKKMGLSQSDLAAELGVHPNTIAKWERGEQPIQHARMLMLALEELQRQRAALRVS